ncbi:MAG: 3-isopropylmalate dehydratase small subunit [Alphaproteobacteria bacterium]|nr:MAG: 3-isopropylmalate dehydratase small subunit [Alphaproteobacteria bacterium]
MQKFTTLSGLAAALPTPNVDTDQIIPKQFLTTIQRKGLAKGLFYDSRFDEKGNKKSGFVLNESPWDQAKILIAGENFGCGSSREHAPWALMDFGITCVIASSFADIFYNNCFKNFMLPIILPQDKIDQLLKLAANKSGYQLNVDLPNQTISGDGIAPIKFQVDAFRKHCLINGLDDIGLTLEKSSAIDAFEAKQKQAMPWLWNQG